MWDSSCYALDELSQNRDCQRSDWRGEHKKRCAAVQAATILDCNEWLCKWVTDWEDAITEMTLASMNLAANPTAYKRT